MAYYYDENGNLVKEKKKKKQTNKSQTKQSSSYYYYDDSGNLTKSSPSKKSNNDIAPVKESKVGRFLSKFTDDYAPPPNKKDKKDDERTWFQKGAYGKIENRFEDGYDFGDFSKTMFDVHKANKATQVDFGENLATGLLGIGEKSVDAGAMLGTAMNEGAMSQSTSDMMMANALLGKGKENKGLIERNQKIQKEVEEKTAKFVAKDLYNEEAIAKKIITAPNEKFYGFNVDEDSVLGEKSDALVQSGGQLVAQLGADALLPGSGMALMGATAFGSEAENAFNQGATFDEALLSATVTAGAEMLTEKIGGVKFGGKTLTDVAFSKLSSKMTNKLTKVLITSGKITADALAEGGEELLSGYMGAVGQKLSYMKDAEIEDLFSNEDKLESFIGGVVLGGAFGGGESLISGRNAVSGLTKNEQAVVDKVFKDEVAKKEENGKKLTSREKTKLYDNIIEQMDKGGIEIDTIESVLGGEDYKAYKDIADFTDGLSKEFNELGNKQNPTLADQYNYSNLMQRLKDSNAKKSEARAKLDKTMSPFLANSRLVESYNERARKGEAFKADLTQYTGKQREAVERAIKSGVLNNTNKSHYLVNTLSQIEADKGIVFDYTDNKKLKEAGFAVEGKTVNGFEKNGTVTLNVQSAKSWQSVVGHEITHVLEGTDAYTELKNVLFKYAESKGELASRKADLTELYKNLDADIDKELTADLVGDYLFSDKDFINHLTGNISTFKKVYEQVKYLYKVATGKQLTEIEKVKQEFDKVWKELSEKGIDKVVDAKADKNNLSVSGVNSKTADSSLLAKEGINYSVSNAEPTVSFNGKPFWVAMVNRRTGNIEKTWTYEESEGENFDLERYVDTLEDEGYVFFTTDLLQDNNRIEYDDYGDRLPDFLIKKINEQISVKPTTTQDKIEHKISNSELEIAFEEELLVSNDASKYKDFKSWVSGEGAENVTEEILTGWGTERCATDTMQNLIDGKYRSAMDANPQDYDIELHNYLEELINKYVSGKIEESDLRYTSYVKNKSDVPFDDWLFDDYKPDFDNSKNVKYSVSEDSNGNELSLAVQKRFANSKAVDENGN
jgi:hypothetical protein